MAQDIIIYTDSDGNVKLDVRIDSDSVWLSQDQMATLFGRDKSTISRHIKNIFQEGELQETSVVAKFATTATDGKVYQVDYYNLDVIISVGYRVKSLQGTQFRIWATQRLREYIIKGFTLNDERLKSGSSYNYFKELLDRIREIRLSEKVFYQQIKDIYALSVDYDPKSEMTLRFFKEVQNKFLFAVSQQTAAELIYYRANGNLPMMGLTSTEHPNKVKKSDIAIGKNYLTERELDALKLLVEQFLAYAEQQARAEKKMYMKDWIEKLSQILTMNDMTILEHAGGVSHKQALNKANEEYSKYKQQQQAHQHLESIKQLDADLKKLSSSKK